MKLYHILAVAAFLPFVSCDNSDNWTPGPVDDAAGVKAYFPVPSKTSYEFEADADESSMVFDVKVSRSITTDAISIPVSLTSDSEGVTVLGNADFAAGQETTTVSVNVGGIPIGKDVTVTLTLPEDQYYTYGVGMPSAQFSVIKARWIEISSNVTYSYYDTGNNQLYPDTYGVMYQLEGNTRFKLTDFFGSGLDMTFNCNTPDETTMSPLINADFENVYDEDKEENGWYLYNEAEQTWPSWVPGGLSGYTAIWDVTFYDNDYDTLLCMVSDPDTLAGYLSCLTAVTFADGTFKWGGFFVNFNLKYNPFEK